MAKPATQNLTIVRGDTETVVVNLTTNGTTPIDITGRTYRAQIRSSKDSASILGSFVCTVTNAVSGQVTCVLSAGATAVLPTGLAYWDFEETNGSVVTTVLAGTVTVLADVSR